MCDGFSQSTLDVPLRKIACVDLQAIHWDGSASSHVLHWDPLLLPVTILWVQGSVRLVRRQSSMLADELDGQYDVNITDHSGSIDVMADENELMEMDQVHQGDYCGALLELRGSDDDGRLNVRCVRLTPMPAAFQSLWMQELAAYRSHFCK